MCMYGIYVCTHEYDNPIKVLFLDWTLNSIWIMFSWVEMSVAMRTGFSTADVRCCRRCRRRHRSMLSLSMSFSRASQHTIFCHWTAYTINIPYAVLCAARCVSIMMHWTENWACWGSIRDRGKWGIFNLNWFSRESNQMQENHVIYFQAVGHLSS